MSVGVAIVAFHVPIELVATGIVKEKLCGLVVMSVTPVPPYATVKSGFNQLTKRSVGKVTPSVTAHTVSPTTNIVLGVEQSAAKVAIVSSNGRFA
jgi:hypothetical protein